MFIQPHHETLLNRWFSMRLPRHAFGPYNSSEISQRDALFCAQIYKRGIRGLCNENGEETELTALVNQHKLAPGQEGHILNHAVNLVPPTLVLNSSEVLKFLENIAQKNTHSCFFIVDSGFAHNWPPIWDHMHSLGSSALYTPTESAKTPDGIRHLYEQVVQSKCTYIVGVGGGITLDVSGFIAGLLGLHVSYVATTLLAASDASMGGKTGVNFHSYGKNQLGLFVPTDQLVVGVDFFSTLPQMEFLNALAECAKHSFLGGTWTQSDGCDRPDSPLLNHVLKEKEKSDPKILRALVAKQIAFKARIVSLDPLEAYQRKCLNLGHTLGHALEGLSEQKWIHPLSHGVAVAAGMKALCRGGLLDGVPPSWEAFLDALLAEAHVVLPIVTLGSQDSVLKTLEALLASDKKNESADSGAAFVLPCYGDKRLVTALKKEESDSSWIRWLSWDKIMSNLLPHVLRFGWMLCFWFSVCSGIVRCGFKADPQPLLPSPPSRIMQNASKRQPAAAPQVPKTEPATRH